MFHSISWLQYWTCIIVACCIYYLVIITLYFRGSVRKMLFSKEGKTFAFVNSETNKDPDMPSLFGPHDDEQIVYSCMDELTAFFESQKRSKVVKSELMYGLYMILQKYPSIRNSGYKESLSNVIATQCENICSIHLSADELKGVWFG
jgi:hypothetical protein